MQRHRATRKGGTQIIALIRLYFALFVGGSQRTETLYSNSPFSYQYIHNDGRYQQSRGFDPRAGLPNQNYAQSLASHRLWFDIGRTY